MIVKVSGFEVNGKVFKSKIEAMEYLLQTNLEMFLSDEFTECSLTKLKNRLLYDKQFRQSIAYILSESEDS